MMIHQNSQTCSEFYVDILLIQLLSDTNLSYLVFKYGKTFTFRICADLYKDRISLHTYVTCFTI